MSSSEIGDLLKDPFAELFTPCIMASNTYEMCPYTRTHLG